MGNFRNDCNNFKNDIGFIPDDDELLINISSEIFLNSSNKLGFLFCFKVYKLLPVF